MSKNFTFVDYFNADTERKEKKKRRRKEVKKELPYASISKVFLSNGGLPAFSFLELLLCGHWRHLCTVDIIVATEEGKR